MSRNIYTDMGEKTNQQLIEENCRLQLIADHDWLTGLYNRGAMERIVNEHLREKSTGTIIVLDLDHFKLINDRYGHIVGDELLRIMGTILPKIVGRQSLVGRVGGDEFVIFIEKVMSGEAQEQLFEQIRNRFREVRLKNSLLIKMSLTIAGADSMPDWKYKDLFDCADQKVLEIKQNRNSRIPYRKTSGIAKGLNLDMRRISDELKEDDVTPGAYCQDYDTFKRMYRLTERRLIRDKQEAYIILFTLTDRNNAFLPMDIRDQEMVRLENRIRECLRMGDIYTQYSSSQYLVMVSGVQGTNTEGIAQRICQGYYNSHEEPGQHVVLHHSYPMSPAGKRKSSFCDK